MTHTYTFPRAARVPVQPYQTEIFGEVSFVEMGADGVERLG